MLTFSKKTRLKGFPVIKANKPAGYILLTFSSFLAYHQPKLIDFFLDPICVFACPIISKVNEFNTTIMSKFSYGEQFFKEHHQLVLENARLKEQNSKLTAWYQDASVKLGEFNELKKNIRLTDSRSDSFVTVPILLKMLGRVKNTFLIGAGSSQSLSKNDIVLCEKGLVGRITKISPLKSSVLLITDKNSKIPVVNLRTQEKAIACGNGEKGLMIDFFKSPTGRVDIKRGDVWVTSGEGGVYPQNIPVVYVTSITPNHISAKSFQSFDKLTFIQVMKAE